MRTREIVPPGALAYLVKEYPVTTETFIWNEVRAMEAEGLPVMVIALKRPPARASRVRPPAAEAVTAPVFHAPRGVFGLPRLVAAHLRALLRGPDRYGRQWARDVGKPLAELLRRPDARRRRVVAKKVRRFAWAGWVADLVDRRRVAHLHAHYATEPARTAHAARKLCGVPYSFTAHAKDLFTAPPARLARLTAAAEFAVTCHGEGARRLRAVAGEGREVLYVRHGLDTDLFRPGPVERDPSRLLAVGRLTPKKGFEDLIRACALLAFRGRRVACDIVGEGSLESALRDLIAELGLEETVRLRPFVDQTELVDLYRRTGIFVMPSVELASGNRDGIPNVLLEAMACGAPVVATRAGSIAEVLEPKGGTALGRLAHPGEPETLATALADLLADPTEAAVLGRRASEAVAAMGYRESNEPLAARFRLALAKPVEDALAAAVDPAAATLAAKAKKRVGLKPRPTAAGEAVIRRAVVPGLAANAWRPDLARLAERRLWDEVVKARRVPKMLRRLGCDPAGAPPGPVLDLGCGRGGLSVALAARGARVVPFDLRRRNCAVTVARGARYRLDLPAVTGVGERLPFADDAFATVFCLEVMEHVRDPETLLTEIRRVLRPDGRCLLTVINRWAHLDPHYHLWGINFLPRSWARAYIRRRGRVKESYRDLQTLDEMHYFGYRQFVRFAARLGFRVEEPDAPRAGWAGLRSRLERTLSVGWNTRSVVLRPVPPGRPSARWMPRSRARGRSTPSRSVSRASTTAGLTGQAGELLSG